MLVTQNVALVTGDLNTIDDVQAGGGMTDGIAHAPGQVGNIYAFGNDNLPEFDATVGTLLSGMYQYVKAKASPTTVIAKGLTLYWSDKVAYTVTADITDALSKTPCGVAIGTITAGQFGFMQVQGVVDKLMKATTTKATPVIGDLVVTGVDADNGRADVLADVTVVTFGTLATASNRGMGRLLVAVDGNDFGRIELLDIPLNI